MRSAPVAFEPLMRFVRSVVDDLLCLCDALEDGGRPGALEKFECGGRNQGF